MADPGSGIIGGVGQVGQLATGGDPLTAFAFKAAGDVLGGLLTSPQGTAKGGVLFTSPITVNVTTGEGDISDARQGISGIITTSLYVLGGFLIARQFRPKQSKSGGKKK